MSHSERHLEGERIQGFLDRRLGPEAERAVRTHLDSCARCRAEVDEWRALFVELSEMPEVSPSPSFREQVMKLVEIPSGSGLLASLGRLLRSGRRRILSRRHVEPRVALAYLDRALPTRRRKAVAAHVEGCPSCRKEVARWRSVIDAVEALGHERPGPDFADGVMARVEVPRPAVEGEGGVLDDLAARIRNLMPRSRRGWALAGTSALAPVAAMTTAAVALFTSHPLLTPGSLASFTWWQVTGAIQGAVGALAQRVLASPLVLEAWQAAEGLSGEPLLAGAGVLAFCFTTLTALWILYRNLATTPPVDRGYANVSA